MLTFFRVEHRWWRHFRAWRWPGERWFGVCVASAYTWRSVAAVLYRDTARGARVRGGHWRWARAVTQSRPGRVTQWVSFINLWVHVTFFFNLQHGLNIYQICLCVCLKYGHFLSVRLTVSRLGNQIRIICELFSSYETKLNFSVDIKT